MKRCRAACVIPLCVLALGSCLVNALDSTTIHMAGYTIDERNQSTARYWTVKGGEDQWYDLGEGYARSICASDGVLYVAGFTSSLPGACYWIIDGGTATQVYCDAPVWAEAHAICASEGVVYTAGAYTDGDHDVVCCWVTTGGVTTRTDLYAGSEADASAIAVLDGAVYVAGCCSNGQYDVACCWVLKDGTTTKTDLFTDGESKAEALCAFGDAMYVAGKHYANPTTTVCYWTITNGAVTETTCGGYNSGAEARSICVTDSNVWVTGWYGEAHAIACCWSNGLFGTAQTDLYTDASSCATSCAVSEGTAFIAGYYYPDDGSDTTTPCLWAKNAWATKKTDLSPSSSETYVTSLCVE
jgi:hypothetical protein